MKSLLVIVILALVCAGGLYTQYTGKQKRIEDAANRERIANAEIAKKKPRLDALRERYAKLRKEADDMSANLPKAASEAALKVEQAKLDAAKAALAEERARPVPDPPVPAVQAAVIEEANKRLAVLKAELAQLEKDNVRFTKYYNEEKEVLPKPKTPGSNTPQQQSRIRR